MKNYISYYYQMSNFDLIDVKEDGYEIIYNNNSYKLIEVKRNISELLAIFNSIKIPDYFDKIIFNRTKNIFSLINGKNYLLLKLNKSATPIINEIINTKSIVYTNTKNHNKGWKELWIKKVNAIEKKKTNSYLVNFCIGLSENAIKYYDYCNLNEINLLTVSHYRINDFYNPLSIIIDYKVRDIAEYIKYKYFYYDINDIELNYILNNSNLTKAEYILLFSRILYPSIIFDIIDDEEMINSFNIIKKISKFDIFLKKIYLLINSKEKIPPIDWI